MIAILLTMVMLVPKYLELAKPLIFWLSAVGAKKKTPVGNVVIISWKLESF